MNATASAPTSTSGTLQLKIGGMSCSFCANSISSALMRDKGVREAHVSLAHEEVLIRFDRQETDEARIKHTLTDLGFTIRDPRKASAFEEQKRAIREEATDLAMAATAALILFMAMSAMWLGLWQMRDWHVWTAWAIATFVLLWNGRRIVRMAWGAGKRGITNQHVLLSVGCAFRGHRRLYRRSARCAHALVRLVWFRRLSGRRFLRGGRVPHRLSSAVGFRVDYRAHQGVGKRASALVHAATDSECHPRRDRAGSAHRRSRRGRSCACAPRRAGAGGWKGHRG
ncbi:MAG TPA: hypothetical protein DD951_05325 [Sulfitobacter pontiacus]|nr:hypothetical protein [Rhodospirillaceae bacterium]MAO92751.1 hypothetical protein [Rhodospirillales bacterium]MAX64896.1 hypothetical protein [Rhodospirillaceae bacterium]MBB57129.1 hypothetical protein [Rhodospirillaceae bacterium]HBR40710.1 hypothetical protein [Sulfitobacter pontiacus]